MSTLTAGYTIVEMAKNIAPDGTQMKIAETMALEMAMLQDIPWFPSNDIWAHKSLRQGKLPTGSWRGINEYITPGVALTDEITDVMGMIDDFAIYDKKWIDSQPDPRMARLGRAKMYLEGMSKTMVEAFLYSNNAIYPKRPHGLEPRLGSLGRYVISAGDSSNLTSIYVVTYGEGMTYGVYPKHLMGPDGDFLVKQTDMTGPEGIVVDNGSGGKLVAYQDHFEFQGGLVNEHPESIGRVANIDNTTASTISFEDKLITLLERMKTGPGTVIYMNEALRAQARIRMKDKNNVNWSPDGGTGLFGEKLMSFDEIPIKKIDSEVLLNSETAVS